MYAATLAAVVVTMSLALVRAYYGPTIFDRILALNMFGTKTVLFIAVVCFLIDRPEFIDLALVYVLLNFVGVIALLRLFRYRHMGETPEARP